MREVIHTINDATETTTGQPIDLDNAVAVSFQFQRSNHSAGKTVFSVSVSNDGTTYTTCNLLVDNVVNSNVQSLTRVASYDTGAANATKMYFLDPLAAQSVKYLKVTATETTDGTHNAWVCVQRDR